MKHIFLKLPEVSKRTGFKKTKIYKDMKAGQFPKPIPLSKNCVAWLESEIIKWQEEKIKNRQKLFTEMVKAPANNNNVLNDNLPTNNQKSAERYL